MLQDIIAYDQELFLYLNSLGAPIWDAFWLFITNKLSSIPLYIVLLCICIKKIGAKKTILVLVLVAALVAATDQLAQAFKYGFERLRPCHTNFLIHKMRLVKPHCGGWFGYFSAHAANSFGVAIFFTLLLRAYFSKIGYILLVWASLVAYSRIYIGVHFPLDVITGLFLGSLLGYLFFQGYKKLSLRVN